MRDRRGRFRGVLFLAVLGVAVVPRPARAAIAGLKIETASAGLSFENFGRTIVWKGEDTASKIRVNLVSARADLRFGKSVIVGLTAGLALTDHSGLTFSALPLTLQFDAAPLAGFSLGADVVAPIRRFSDFEISGTGRVVYSFGMSKTWPLEGFAVEGRASGSSSWGEIAAGPRVAYLFFGRVVPYLEVWARWLGAGFAMSETLGDLAGRESRRIRGDLSVSVALGADAAVTDRIAVKGRAGIVPFAGGVDGLVSIGVLYKF